MNQIMPQEFNLLSDIPVIRTRCPHGDITEEMVAKQVKRGNLVAGDRVLVQSMSHEYDELLAEAEFRVVSRKSSMVTADADEAISRTYEKTVFHVKQCGKWWVLGKAGPGFVSGKTRWNPGLQAYEILVDGKVRGVIADKEMARQVASGELPLPADAVAA